ncbi:MAG: hypothetical protein U0169_04840 [Polyangiaceae bacterium]
MATAVTDPANLDLAYDGTSYVLAWHDVRTLAAGSAGYVARVSRAGAVLDGMGGVPVAPATREESQVALAVGGTGTLVVWRDTREPYSHIRSRRLSSAGALAADDFVVSTAGVAQLEPTVASDGAHAFVGWIENRAAWTDGTLLVRRMTPEGTLPDGAPTVVAPGIGPDRRAFDLASDGTNVHAFFTTGGTTTVSAVKLQSTRLKPDGTLLDPAPRELAPGRGTMPGHPRAAWGGDRFLVVWDENALAAPTERDVAGVLVAADGTVLVPPFLVSSAGSSQYAPSVAWNGTDFVVVWLDDRGAAPRNLHGARVRPDGAVTDPAGFVVSTSLNAVSAPALATLGTDVFVAYSGSSGGASDADVFVVRIDPTATVGTPCA